MSNIEDGTGSGRLAKVGVGNRLHTHSLAATTVEVATIEGNVFEVNSALVTLTTANESGILYIKNNEDKDIGIVITHVRLGASTSGVGSGTLFFNYNSTTGTLISVANAATVVNRNLGDSILLSADAFSGVEGSTITDGIVVGLPISESEEHQDVYVLAKSKSLAISYQPPTSNTSQQVQINFILIKNFPKYTIE